jgi:hypothetical protein
MNTARAFGPAAVQGFPNDSHWIVRRALISTPSPSFSPPPPTGTPPRDSPRTYFSQFLGFSSRDHAGEIKSEKGKKQTP